MPNKLAAVLSLVFLTIIPAYAASLEPNSVPLDQNSLQLLIDNANKGDANAQFNLGRCYDKGEGVPQDYKVAFKWLSKAAEQGHARAQNGLGSMYFKGDGVPQDYNEAIKWFKKAIEQGDERAQLNLGLCYYNGVGVEQNYNEATKWITKAAEQGNAHAQHTLGLMYENGEVSTQSLTQRDSEAAKWFRESLKKVIPLDKGIYGIPFNATIDEVLVWCKDNNMIILNNTEKAILQDINDNVSKITGLEESHIADIQSLQGLELQLLKIMKSNISDPNISTYAANRENTRIETLLTKMETLKNPCFSYAGEKYYLNSIFPNGIEMRVDGKPQFFKGPETICVLILRPTKESERMTNNGLKQLNISFYGSQGQPPKTFVTLAYFSDSPNKSVQAQCDFTSEAISEKYGSPLLFNYDLVRLILNDDLRRPITDVIYHDMFLLTGEKWSELSTATSFVMWARNIRLFGGFLSSMSLRSDCDAFGLLYYEPNAFTRLSENRKKAIENFEKEYYKQRKQESEKMRENF